MLTILNYLKWLATVRIRDVVNVVFSFKGNIAASPIIILKRLSLKNITT